MIGSYHVDYKYDDNDEPILSARLWTPQEQEQIVPQIVPRKLPSSKDWLGNMFRLFYCWPSSWDFDHRGHGIAFDIPEVDLGRHIHDLNIQGGSAFKEYSETIKRQCSIMRMVQKKQERIVLLNHKRATTTWTANAPEKTLLNMSSIDLVDTMHKFKTIPASPALPGCLKDV